MFTSSEVQDGVVTLTVVGEVDIAVTDEFAAVTSACLALPGATTLRVDVADVTFLDSSGLGSLVRARNEAAALGKDLVIANASTTVAKVFRISGLSGVLVFDPDLPGG